METSHMNIELLEAAKKGVKRIKRFYIHITIFVIANVLYLLKEYFNMPFNFWPINYLNHLNILIWSSILVIQSFNLFAKDLFFGKKWEANRIQKILEKNNEKQNWE